ncbi:MAG: DUF1587 domain-containing protein, partial [Phycisphaerales bacterium]
MGVPPRMSCGPSVGGWRAATCRPRTSPSVRRTRNTPPPSRRSTARCRPPGARCRWCGGSTARSGSVPCATCSARMRSTGCRARLWCGPSSWAWAAAGRRRREGGRRARVLGAVRDVFGADALDGLSPDELLPADDVGEGFDTTAATLGLPALLVEKYM